MGLGSHVKTKVLREFLCRFIERLQQDKSGPRDYWERLAKQFAANPDYTAKPEKFVLSLMNLVNEMYHYNFGIMLAAETDVSVSVETQTSAAFDDLLVVKDRIHGGFLSSEPAGLAEDGLDGG